MSSFILLRDYSMEFRASCFGKIGRNRGRFPRGVWPIIRTIFCLRRILLDLISNGREGKR